MTSALEVSLTRHYSPTARAHAYARTYIFIQCRDGWVKRETQIGIVV